MGGTERNPNKLLSFITIMGGINKEKGDLSLCRNSKKGSLDARDRTIIHVTNDPFIFMTLKMGYFWSLAR